MAVNQNKWLKVHTWMSKLGIHESQLEEQFVQGSGPGGQKINKTSSCVTLKHLPTNIMIKCQRSRYRDLNRLYARQELCMRLEERSKEALQAIQKERAKERQRNRKPSQAEKLRSIEEKRKKSYKKTMRKPPKIED